MTMLIMSMAKRQFEKYKTLYVDMDGVLVNFNGGCEKLWGRPWESYTYDERQEALGLVGLQKDFWFNLEPMPDCFHLWEYVEHFEPHILTATPSWEDPNCISEKYRWIEKHLGIPRYRIHVVKRVEKRHFAMSEGQPNVLIDDRDENILEFQGAGGVGVSHLNAPTSITALKALGYVKT